MVRASAVVLATGPRDASKLVGGGERPALRRLVDRLVPARVVGADGADLVAVAAGAEAALASGR